MSSPQELSFSYSWPNGQAVESSEVDSWELKASRRALRNLKTLLAGQPMLDLLKDQMEEADAYYKEIIEKSNGEYTESRFDIKAKGITKIQFINWWNTFMVELHNPDTKQKVFLDTMAPSHPEHYSIPSSSGGVVETIGGHIARAHIRPCLNPPDFVLAYSDSTYEQLPGIGTLADGTTMAYLLHEVRDSEEGCEFRLRIIFPVAAPQLMLDEHCEHLAVEFGSFISTASEWNKQQLSSN